jgi:ABC-type transporter Mla MlaB component
MLRITVQEDGAIWSLYLSGKLAGPWVAETANVWRQALRSGKQIEVDLNEITGVDAAGRMLLASMHEAGARLRAAGVANTALIAEIAGGQQRRPRNADVADGGLPEFIRRGSRRLGIRSGNAPTVQKTEPSRRTKR